MDEKKQDMFLNGLNDDIQFQLLNTNYADFHHMVDKVVVIENKIKEMEKDGTSKVSLLTSCFRKILKFAKIMHVTKIAIGNFQII
jgi:hypothetical protein